VGQSEGQAERVTMASILLASIRLDFQSSDCLDPETVQKYVYDIEAGKELEPIELYFDGENYWAADGFHRIEAARLCGLQEISASITPGTYADLEARWTEYLAALRLRQEPIVH